MASTETSHKLFSELRIGDHVRLRDEQESSAGWSVIGRSFGSMTVDLMSDDPRGRGRMLQGVRPDLVELIEPSP
jgi:hypothetical protein